MAQASSASNSTFGNLTSINVTTATVTVSLPAPTQSQIPSFEGILDSLVQSFGSGDDSQLGNFLQQILTNITSGIVRNLSKNTGDLGQLFGDIVQNVTTGIKEEISKVGAPVLQQALQGLVTGNHNGSLSNSHGVDEFVDGVLGNFSTGITNGISRAQGTAAIGIANALGIQQFYTVHLRQICFGTFSDKSDPNAKFNIFGCFNYPEAAIGNYILLRSTICKGTDYMVRTGLEQLISNIPNSTTVLSTNISIPAISKVGNTLNYINSLANTLSKTIFSFYILSIVGSGAIMIGSLLGFLFPANPAIMYCNLGFSILSSFASLAGSATVTAFITTAYNMINIFGSSLGLRAGLGSPFLILIWLSFGLTCLTNWYVLGVWFFQFRTIEVRVERRSPQFLVPPTSPQRLTETVETSGDTVPTIKTINTFNSKTSFSIRRGSRRQSQYADF